MLFTLAQREVWMAEIATQMQRTYQPPDRWSLKALTWMTFLPDRPPPRKGRYAYVIDNALERFNPSRAILGLEQRGFVLRDRHRRHANLCLTAEGDRAGPRQRRAQHRVGMAAANHRSRLTDGRGTPRRARQNSRTAPRASGRHPYAA
jgi:hypothetical protein